MMALQQWLNEKKREARRAAHAEQTFRNFLRDLRAREPMTERAAARAAAAVLCGIERSLSGDDRHSLEAQLPSRLRELVASCPLHFGRDPAALNRVGLLAIVAEETGTTRREAERLVRCVLTTVRMHVSEGEVSRVVQRLPAEIAELWEARAAEETP